MFKVLGAVCLLLFAGFAAAFLFPSWEPTEEDTVRIVSPGPYVLAWDSGQQESHQETVEGEERYRDHPIPAGEFSEATASVTAGKDGFEDGAVYMVIFQGGEYTGCGSTGDNEDRSSEITLYYGGSTTPAVCSTYRFWSWFG